MASAAGTIIETLARVRGMRRQDVARDAIARDIAWADWRDAFTAVYVRDPHGGLAASEALAEAAERVGDSLLAARLRVVRGLALQRAGSPEQAARAFMSARDAFATDDPAWAAIAGTYAVDALAHAGDPEAALRLGHALKRELPRSGAPGRFGPVLWVNLGNAHRLLGELADAIRNYDRAARSFGRRGLAGNAAIARMNGGVARVYAGQVTAGRARIRDAAARFDQLEEHDRAREAHYNAAWAQIFDGNLGAGLASLHQLADGHASADRARLEGLCRMDLAQGLLVAGDRAGAGAQAKRAADRLGVAGASAEAHEAQLWLAVAEGRSAADWGRLATRLRKAKRADLALRAETLRLDAALQAGDRIDLRRVNRLRREALNLNQGVAVALLDLVRGEALSRSRRWTDAISAFRLGMGRTHGIALLRLAAETGVARAEAASGDTSAALRRLGRVAALVERLRVGLPGSWLRASFLVAHLDPVLTRVELLLHRDAPRDRRRAAELLDDVALRAFLEARDDPPLRDEAAGLRRRLQSLYDALADGAGGARGITVPPSVLLGEARRIESRLAQMWRVGELRGPRASSLRTTRHPAVHPHGGGAHLHLWIDGDELRGLLRAGATTHPARRLGSASQLHALHAELKFHARRALRLGSLRAHADVEELLAQLGAAVLQPLALPDGCASLRVVCGPGVPDLPLEVLPYRNVPLAGGLTFARVPAFAGAAPRRRKPPRVSTEYVSAAGGELAGVAREAQHLRGVARVQLAGSATRTAALRALTRADVVHISGHGVAGGAVPPLGGVRLHDGWLTTADLPRAIASSLVILAACQTHEGGGTAAMAWGGMPSALLRRGARHVVWTAADVDDSATAELTTALHSALGDLDAPAAFGRAIASLIEGMPSAAAALDFRITGWCS